MSNTSGNGTNGLSIAGFVVSIASLFLGLFGITGIVGIVLSAVGLNQAKREGGGTALAITGIILGIIGAGYCWIQLAKLASL